MDRAKLHRDSYAGHARRRPVYDPAGSTMMRPRPRLMT